MSKKPPPPLNPDPTSLKTLEDFPDKVERRAKARAKHEQRAAKAKKVEAQNVEFDSTGCAEEEGAGLCFPSKPLTERGTFQCCKASKENYVEKIQESCVSHCRVLFQF